LNQKNQSQIKVERRNEVLPFIKVGSGNGVLLEGKMKVGMVMNDLQYKLSGQTPPLQRKVKGNGWVVARKDWFSSRGEM